MSSADLCGCDDSRAARAPSPSRIPLPPRERLEEIRNEYARRARECREWGDVRRAEDCETVVKRLECVC